MYKVGRNLIVFIGNNSTLTMTSVVVLILTFTLCVFSVDNVIGATSDCIQCVENRVPKRYIRDKKTCEIVAVITTLYELCYAELLVKHSVNVTAAVNSKECRDNCYLSEEHWRYQHEEKYYDKDQCVRCAFRKVPQLKSAFRISSKIDPDTNFKQHSIYKNLNHSDLGMVLDTISNSKCSNCVKQERNVSSEEITRLSHPPMKEQQILLKETRTCVDCINGGSRRSFWNTRFGPIWNCKKVNTPSILQELCYARAMKQYSRYRTLRIIHKCRNKCKIRRTAEDDRVNIYVINGKRKIDFHVILDKLK